MKTYWYGFAVAYLMVVVTILVNLGQIVVGQLLLAAVFALCSWVTVGMFTLFWFIEFVGYMMSIPIFNTVIWSIQ